MFQSSHPGPLQLRHSPSLRPGHPGEHPSEFLEFRIYRAIMADMPPDGFEYETCHLQRESGYGAEKVAPHGEEERQGEPPVRHDDPVVEPVPGSWSIAGSSPAQVPVRPGQSADLSEDQEFGRWEAIVLSSQAVPCWGGLLVSQV